MKVLVNFTKILGISCFFKFTFLCIFFLVFFITFFHIVTCHLLVESGYILSVVYKKSLIIQSLYDALTVRNFFIFNLS